MNKKLYVYSVCLAIVYIVFLGHGFYEMVDAGIGGFKFGVKEFQNENITKSSSVEVFGLFLTPNEGTSSFPSSVLNEKTGENMRFEIREAFVFLTQMPASVPGYIKALKIINGLLILFFLFLFVYLPFVAWKIMKSVSREQFYSKKNIDNLRKVSVILLSIFFVNTITNTLASVIAAFYLNMEGYKIAFGKFAYEFLFIGLVILILSEIIRYTTSIKEEADLTI